MRKPTIRRGLTAAAVLLLALFTATATRAFEPGTTGVVVVHGKWGRPGDQWIGPFAERLKTAGFLVEQPDMPWSGNRLYDRDYDAGQEDIAAAAARLRARGATKIAVAGHSLGGSAALKYATLGKPVDAIVLIDPAQFPEGYYFREHAGESLARAQAMVAAGKGGETGSFLDLNSDDRSRLMPVAAAVYVSYYAPDGPAAMSLFAAKTGPAPILWIAGKFDVATAGFDRLAWSRVAASTPKTRIDVVAHHMDAPIIGAGAVIDWLKAR